MNTYTQRNKAKTTSTDWPVRVAALVTVVITGLSLVIITYHHYHSETVSKNEITTGYSQSTNISEKYTPVFKQIGQMYYDDNHLIGYQLKSVNVKYVDPKLQNEDYCPEYQQLQAQGSHTVRNISCTITSKLLTWEFTNTTNYTVAVPGVHAMYSCMASSAASKDTTLTPETFAMMSEGYDSGLEPAGLKYWVNHTSYPADPANSLSEIDIQTGKMKDMIYQPGETKEVKTELGHNCTVVGNIILGGSYEGWKI